ncbi:Selenoprotein T [Fukomys damarensis]|uniref:Selenoprotein T n=1 Tax=Fukomys damarensis TaxID=885580 RepID=A0A091DQQ4_FUKDA|nr:Selenoprotein T [Fukomys damarensis]
MRFLLLLFAAASAVVRSEASADLGDVPTKRLKMQYATGPLLKFQIWYVRRPVRPAAPSLVGVTTRGPGLAAYPAAPSAALKNGASAVPQSASSRTLPRDDRAALLSS